MSLVDNLIERYFGVSNGELLIGGVTVTELADQYGTPLYIYDSGVIDKKLKLLRETLPPEFDVYYSVKANPNPVIIKQFVAAGCGLEIASAGEFSCAVEAGCAPKNILFAGPGKTERELEFVLRHGIGEIHIESLVEAERINAICCGLQTRARVAVRVNPSAEVQGGAMRMGGKPAPFGIDEEKVDEAIDYLLARPALDLRGVHLFTGTQILDYTILISQYQRGLDIARRVAARIPTALKTVDFGGGFGISYYENDPVLDMASLGERLQAMMTKVRLEPWFRDTRFVVEPGRYLVGEAGVYVARVNDIKLSRGKKFLILDGGMNHHLAASGNLGQVIKRNFPIALVSKLDTKTKDRVEIVGPLCTPLDTLARDVEVSVASIGDIVGIFQSGAYGRSASPFGFLSHPCSPEILISNGKPTIIHRRGTLADSNE